MKHNILKHVFIFFLSIVLAFLLVACKEEKITYLVVFYNGANVVDSVKVNEGEKVSAIEVENGSHTLVGWRVLTDGVMGDIYDFDSPVNANFMLTAEWTYTCTFKNEDDSVIEKVEVKNGDTAKPTTNPTKASDELNTYAFKGWSGSLVCAGSDYEVKAEFTATKISKTVTFYSKDGAQISCCEVANGATVSEINYSVPDDDYYTYTTKGWKTIDGKEYDFNTPVTTDLDLYPITSRTPLPIDFKGKVLSMLGDSVSTFYSKNDANNSFYTGYNEYYYPMYCPNVTKSSQTYWGQLMKKLGLTLGVNESLSGSSLCGNTDRYAMSDYRINNMGSNGTPDIIIIFIGINDNVGGKTASYFEECYDTMLSKVTTKYPNAYVFCTLLPYSNYHLNMPDNHGKYSEETRVSYNEVINRLVKKYEIGVVDLEETQNVNTWSTILNDNLHPHAAGHTAWYNQFYKDIVNYFNQTKTEYTITYNTNGDDVVMPEKTVYTFHEGDTVTLPTPTRTGYTFGGWYTKEDCSNRQTKTITAGKANATYYAEWLENPPSCKYYVKYFLNGGTFTDSNQETYVFASGTVTLPTALTKEGFKFAGWYTNPECIGTAVTKVTASTKVYAKWSAI